VAGDDLEAIKNKTEELTKVVQEVGAAIYQQAQAEQQQQQGPEGPGSQDPEDDEAVDAEYEKK
jgi:molecular chaperone DnaK